MFLVLAVLTIVPAVGRAQKPERPPREPTLRGIFLDEGDDASRDKVVGRLAVQLVADDGARRVGIDHLFHSGDRFRFEVTSTHGGWLYVLHHPPKEDARVVWPPEGLSNRVRPRTTTVVPSSPKAFVFDKEVGEEHFYVVIKATPDDSPPGGEGLPGVRGLGEGLPRGAFFDPGSEDDDIHVYFAAADGDDGTVAVVEFRLRHE